MSKILLEDHTYNAMCLWEAFLDAASKELNTIGPFNDVLARRGYGQTRSMLSRWVPKFSKIAQHLYDELEADIALDWDLAPMVLREYLRLETMALCPEKTPKAIAKEIHVKLYPQVYAVKITA